MNVLQTLNYIRQEGSTEYQDRIPLAVRDNITQVGNAILEHTALKNQFIDALINKVALTKIAGDTFEDPFSRYEGEKINYGDTVEDIFVEFAEGEAFTRPGDSETLDPYRVTKPQIEVLYHTIDREMKYRVTIRDKDLVRAFKSEGSFSSFTMKIIQSLEEARKYDRFIFAKELLATPKNYGMTLDMGEVATATELAGQLIGAVKNWASKMKYRRNDLNALTKETTTPLDNQLLVIREDVKQAIDLQVLAEIFNVTKAELGTRIIEIDAFSTADQVASLVDERGFRIHTALRASESIRNPEGLYTNYFVHDWSLYSYSLYRNAIMFKGTTPAETV